LLRQGKPTTQQKRHAGSTKGQRPFDIEKYEKYLRDDPKAASTATELIPHCNLGVMAMIVLQCFEYGEQNYSRMAAEDKQTKDELECIVLGFQLAAKWGRRQPESVDDAIRWESEAAKFGEILRLKGSDSRPKMRGALRGKQLPGAILYLVVLEEYITAKTGARALPNKMVQVIHALLAGFKKHTDISIDQELLAKRITRYRKDNPLDIEAVKRMTECDSSGQNALDRMFGGWL